MLQNWSERQQDVDVDGSAGVGGIETENVIETETKVGVCVIFERITLLAIWGRK